MCTWRPANLCQAQARKCCRCLMAPPCSFYDPGGHQWMFNRGSSSCGCGPIGFTSALLQPHHRC
eukprot:1459780-Prorocentrum_lima.AAC.1